MRLTLKHFVAFNSFILLVLIISTSFQFSQARNDRALIRSNQIAVIRSLCTVRASYDTNIRRSVAFLRTHPKGIPGITATVIRQGIHDTSLSRDALRDLPCD